MFNPKEYTGIAVDYASIDLARVIPTKEKLRILDLERLDLAEPLESRSRVRQFTGSDSGNEAEKEADDVFGIAGAGDTESEMPAESGIDDLSELNELDPFEELTDLESLEMESVDEFEVEDSDLVDEADHPDSNEMILYNYLASLHGKNRIQVGLNIRSGFTHFQFSSDADYSSLKSKEIQKFVEKKLRAVHGELPEPNRYRYYVDEEKRLCIASLDREPQSLTLLNRVEELSRRRKIFVREIIPDEVALVGFYRLNYPVKKEKKRITALIQFRKNHSRIIFLSNHRILQISPVIQEGSSHKSALDTIFSKMLFQMDTGEVPEINRIVLCDNILGEESVNYFKKSFPDLDVSEFQFDPFRFELPESLKRRAGRFTTAIAIATAASGVGEDHFPDLSIIPDYIHDRQKIFSLQWHGVLLLVAIGLSPIFFNYLYQQNNDRIEQLTIENNRYEMLLTDLQETVAHTGLMEERLASYRQQLTLLHELSEGTMRWTVRFDHVNEAAQRIGGLWITSFRQSPEGLLIEGISLQENRIPQLARQFAHITLVHVQRVELRERSVYQFSMQIGRVVADESLYTPEESRQIPSFLETFSGS